MGKTETKQHHAQQCDVAGAEAALDQRHQQHEGVHLQEAGDKGFAPPFQEKTPQQTSPVCSQGIAGRRACAPTSVYDRKQMMTKGQVQ